MAAVVASPAPRAGVIQVLVGARADEALEVRDTALVALQENARCNTRLILDCCMVSLRTVRRRAGQLGGHHAGMFHTMAHTVLVMDEEDVDPGLLRKIAKLALLEMTTNKDVSSDWQKAAFGLLVAIGSRSPDLMMDEVFLLLGGSSVSTLVVVQTLSEYAAAEALQFTPRVKGVLSRVLPILGSIKDSQRTVFAIAFRNWCWAMSQYFEDHPQALVLDSDTIAFLHSAFELFLGSWVISWEPKVRLATVEALGEMASLVSTMHLKAALPRLITAILASYKQERSNPFSITRSLQMSLSAVLKSDADRPSIDFQQGLSAVLNTILPMASANLKNIAESEGGLLLKNLNEVVRCFLTIGMAFPDELFAYLISRIHAKEESVRLGALSVFQHLLPRLSESWAERRSQLIESVKPMLVENDLNLRKALVELIVAIVSNGWVESSCGEIFVEFLARQSSIDDRLVEQYKKQEESGRKLKSSRSSEASKTELKMGVVSPGELRSICDKCLFLLASTMPDMEHILWPFLLKLLIPAQFKGAVATLCKCIAEILRRRNSNAKIISVDYISRYEIPKPEEILARLLVLLQNPMEREQLAFRILTVLFYLRPLFPKAVILLWEEEIPKLKAYIDDPEDLKTDTWQQQTWENMILHLLAETLDVINDVHWTILLGNAFTSHYELYIDDHQHTSLLHRCLGVLLQKVDNNRGYVQEKVDIMYKRACISDVSNRLGLAMAMGLVAAEHLDTVLEKLKKILQNHGRNRFQRFFSLFTVGGSMPDVDDVYAALALMYGYAATYAPSTVIEARIDALVGTNMLSGLLDVRTATAKRAVITAIDLLGQSVIKAAKNGACFPLKKRDQMLDYTLKLMSGQDISSSDPELLQTQCLALNACTTLVSVEPKLTFGTRDIILQATLNFFTLPLEPVAIVDLLISKLTGLLRAVLLTSGEDGKSRADQLQHLSRSLDPYVSSPVRSQRSRACATVIELLKVFKGLCTTSYCNFGCIGSCMHIRPSKDWILGNTSDWVQRSGAQSTGALLLPSRESLNLGERFMAYLPRCADVFPEIRKCSAQILDLLFSIALLLPNHIGSTLVVQDKEASYAALSALEELIAVTKWDTVHEDQDFLFHLVQPVSNILTTTELVTALRGCVSPICDKVRLSAQGATRAVSQLICKRGQELSDGDVIRVTQSLLTAAGIVGEKALRQEVLAVVCCLAEHTSAKLVFSELLNSAEKDIMSKDVSMLRGGWPAQDAFIVLAQHEPLALAFLDHVVGFLNQASLDEEEAEKIDRVDHTFNQSCEASLVALTAFFRKGTASKKALEQRYAGVLCALFLQLGTVDCSTSLEIQQSLRKTIKTFEDFCECMGDKETTKILNQDSEQLLDKKKWMYVVCLIAGSVAVTRPKEVETVCSLLWPVLKRTSDRQRAVAVAILSEFVHHCEEPILLSHLVGALCAHIGDSSSTVRKLCMKGLVQISTGYMPDYSSQVLSVIVALIEDTEEEVALTAIQGLQVVLETGSEDAVAPVILSISVRLRSLQIRQNIDLRAESFKALGYLAQFASGLQREAFLEQVHAALPKIVFHINDDALAVRQACKGTLKHLVIWFGHGTMTQLLGSRALNTDHRLDYDDFVRDFTRCLIQSFPDRIDSYLACAIQGLDSSWPTIQANAAYFSGCMLSEITDVRVLASFTPQIVASLMRMAAGSTNPALRSSSVKSLSLLLNSIH